MSKNNSYKLGKIFETEVEDLLRAENLNFIKNYPVMTMTGIRKIDFVILTKYGKILVECKYRDINGTIAANRYAATGLFTVMYEYRNLFHNESMFVIVNDLSILKPGKQNYVPLLTSIGVEVFSFDKKKINNMFQQKIIELKAIS